ncbi:hypothetical protein Bca52824_062850 [Brassica carinata]|uniref:Cation/H+ exchanger transmembrane domain-containing protein n=1 Tax=Brassica carinata TaxID=52824 RepID=A0A8X7QDM2_BRACI|nr:hypothetical protein Bca52824_062850 [Brassica carinata]
MTSVFVPYNRSSEKAGSSSSVESDSSPVDAVIFAGVSLLLGTACRQLFNGTRVPYTVLLLVIGIVLGALEYGTHHNLGKIGNGIRIWNDIDPDLLLAVFLPALLFESSFSMDVHQIKRCIGQMALLAGPGVLISTFCIGSLLKLTFPYDWDWKTSLLLGGLLGATDPVAVVALLKELGASKKMTTLIDGESLMNDGVSVVVFQLFLKMVMGNNSDWGFIIKFLAQNSFGAVGIGVAFGIASVLWLRFVFNDIVVQITVTLSVSYFKILHCSRVGWGFWNFDCDDFGDVFAAFRGQHLRVIATRVCITSGILQLRVLSFIITIKWQFVSQFGDWNKGEFLFFTGGIVFLTLVVNGSTTQLLLHLLHMDSLTPPRYTVTAPFHQWERILEYTKYEMMNTALKAFENLGDDEELGSADWHTVVGHISSLNDLEGDKLVLKMGVQAAYWEMLDDGRITQNTANVLMQSVDEALDLVSTESLCDWRGLKPCVHFPKYYGFLQSRIIPRKLVSYLIVERLESACYISSAFLRAHRIARQQLHGFLGNSDIASIVINESEVQGQEAKQFLVDVRDSFPQVLNVLKTRQVTHYVLNHLNGYIKNLEKVGLLEGKEVSHLHDAVQADLKKLLRNPPLLKLPNANDLITTNPLLRPL